MTDITFKCNKCGELIKANTTDAGQEGECPTCDASIVIPSLPGNNSKPPVSPQTPPPIPVTQTIPSNPPRPQPPSPAKTVITAGWICFAVGIIIAPLIITAPISGTLFLTAMILAVIAIAKGRTTAGIWLLMCSLVVPPVLLITIFTAVLASVFGSLTEVIPKPPPSRRTIALTPPAQEPVRQSLPIGQVFAQLEEAARPYKIAQTSVRKEELRRIAVQKAQALLDNVELTFSAVVSDVTVPREGVARIFFNSSDFSPTNLPKSDTLWVSHASFLDLNMPRSRALTVTPGMGMSIVVHTVFRPSGGNPLANGLNQTPFFLTFRLPGDMHPLGTVYVREARCSISSQRVVTPLQKGRLSK